MVTHVVHQMTHTTCRALSVYEFLRDAGETSPSSLVFRNVRQIIVVQIKVIICIEEVDRVSTEQATEESWKELINERW